MIAADGWRFAAALVLLVGIAVTVVWVGRLPVRAAIPIAVGRAILQLAVVSLAVTAVLSHVGFAIGFAVVMLGVATLTSARRCGVGRRGWPWVLVALAAGNIVVLTVIFGVGAAPLTGPAVVPIAGIVIGGSMSAHTLAVRRAFTDLGDRWGEVEAGLAIGLPPESATREVIHRSIPDALLPALDQTRTVGLVTLPGTFVGVLLGGGSPIQAGTAQVLTLVGILTSQAITVLLAERFVAAGRLLPADLRRDRGHLFLSASPVRRSRR